MSVLTSDAFAKTVRRAQAIDPAIGDTDKVHDILVPPYHDPLWNRLTALQARLRRHHYDHIVCVPWLRSGGADLVSGYLTHALPQIFPGESVLFLRIDQPNFDRPDWLASDVEVLDISDVVLLSKPAEAEQLLFTLIRGMRPRGVYNVNSRLCWRVMRRFGKRVGDDIKLFAYLFCWDQTANGVRVGYPSEFYSDTQACLTALLTDTKYLKDELIRTYALPQDIASRIIPIASPTHAIVPAVTMAQMGAETAYARARPLFLWGGRIDRQKRFDLVLKIARRMPHCDFKCWGMAMLDAAPDLSTLPENVFMMGTFAHFTDLPLAESDGWVFTSAWEGMPTTIIELGILGMPIVASAVGGIPELIDDTTGWLVDPFDSVEGFVDCLNDMIQRPSERMKRAMQLQTRTAARHSMQTYCNTLAPVLLGERV
jgi:glycosyltransferase involved in cell wall biosynthesis